MQDTNVYLELLQERGKKGLPLRRVYRQLVNIKLYLTAYGKIYRNHGALTAGVTQETVDSMSLEKMETIIEAVRQERYQWHPARRTSIPKKQGKKRPLGLPVWSDQLLAEVIRRKNAAYYEPQFSDHSHGFRPGRGCHTALQEISYQWSATTWFIEGDISKWFDSLDHHLLIGALRQRIQDGRFIHLIQKLLEAGYLENWNFHHTLSGVPQGSIVSPILSNILLDKLDKFVETVLIPEYTHGNKRKASVAYGKLMNRAQDLFKKGESKHAQQVRKQAQHLPAGDPNDPHFRRLRYVRYADDFLVGFVGPRSEAEEIKQRIATFLCEELKLDLSKTKTLITHAKSEAARFLGYEISTLYQDSKRSLNQRTGNKRRSINGRIGLRVPQEVLTGTSNRYKRRGKVRPRAELLNESDYTILATYQLEYRGITNDYRLAYNMHVLGQLKWVMEHSLTMTLASKHHFSVPRVYEQFKAELLVKGRSYKGLEATVPREGKEPLRAVWGGIPLIWESKATLEDHPPSMRNRVGRSELEKRLLAQVCEHCGATRRTDPIEVHHIRALKDLNRYPGRDKPTWVKIMAARRRKTLVLCRTCHRDIQYGRPMRRQSIKLKNASPVKTG